MTEQPDSFLASTPEASRAARDLISTSTHAALASHWQGKPWVSRITLALDDDRHLLSLVSDLAPHASALRASPDAAVLIGEAGRGDPLAHPRLTIRVSALFAEKSPELKATFLQQQPKAALYVDFADFHFVRLRLIEGWYNGGFGKAHVLSADDMTKE